MEGEDLAKGKLCTLKFKALKNTTKGDFTNRILWALDSPVGKFNQDKKSYAYNIQVFKSRIKEHFQDETLLKNLLSKNAKNLYNI